MRLGQVIDVLTREPMGETAGIATGAMLAPQATHLADLRQAYRVVNVDANARRRATMIDRPARTPLVLRSLVAAR